MMDTFKRLRGWWVAIAVTVVVVAVLASESLENLLFNVLQIGVATVCTYYVDHYLLRYLIPITEIVDAFRKDGFATLTERQFVFYSLAYAVKVTARVLLAIGVFIALALGV